MEQCIDRTPSSRRTFAKREVLKKTKVNIAKQSIYSKRITIRVIIEGFGAPRRKDLSTVYYG